LKLGSTVTILVIVILILLSNIIIAVNVNESNNNGSRQLAKSPWPCARGNSQCTGWSKYDTSSNGGRLRWTFYGDLWISPSPVVGSGNAVYICGSDGKLYSLNSEGDLNWKIKIGDYVSGSKLHSPAIDSDGTLYIGSGTGIGQFLHAINPDGTLKWQSESYLGICSVPAIGNDGTIYVGGYDGYLYAYYPNGTVKWKFFTKENVVLSPAIASNVIYVGTTDGILFAVDTNGNKKWEYETKLGLPISPAIASNGAIYIGAGSKVFALNSDGNLKWDLLINDIITSPPAVSTNNVVYFGTSSSEKTNEGFLYAISGTGVLKWKFATLHKIESAPVISSEGTLYFGSYDRYVYSVYSDGKLKWKYQTSNSIFCSPAIDSEGSIIISSGGNLYALGQGINLPPLEPKDLTTIGHKNYIDLFWLTPIDDGGGDILNYLIYRSTQSGAETLLKTIDSSFSSYKDETVTKGRTYYYHVTAKNEFGESSPSLEAYATAYGVPDPPQNMQASVGEGYVKLKWNVPINDGGVNLTQFGIYRGSISGAEGKLVFVNATELSYKDSTVFSGQKVYYYVTAVNDFGESVPSDEVSGIPQGKPSEPKNFKVTPGYGKVKLSWEEPGNTGGLTITDYKIYKGASTVDVNFLTKVNSETFNYTDMEVDAGASYIYKLVAENAIGESEPTKELVVTVLINISGNGGNIDKVDSGEMQLGVFAGFSLLIIIAVVIIVIVLIVIIIAVVLLRKKRPGVRGGQPQQTQMQMQPKPQALPASVPIQPGYVAPRAQLAQTSAPTPTYGEETTVCPNCKSNLLYSLQYQKWYCEKCKKYM
jgi:outer membrane protein assembly factor BamB/fibronectin type 3 domain-containing protein